MTDPTAITSFYTTTGYPDQVDNPVAFTATVTAGTGSLSVSWTSVAGALYYNVYCGPSPEQMTPANLKLIATSLTISNLTAGVLYFVQVTAITTPLVGASSFVTSGTPT